MSPKKQKFPLYLQILLGILLSIPAGILLKEKTRYIDWLGTLFINSLKIAVIPLIFSSIISGMSNIGSGENIGRISLKTISFYFITTIIASIIGILSMNLFAPGKGLVVNIEQTADLIQGEKFSLESIINTIVPPNLFNAFTENNLLGILFFAIMLGFSINKLPASKKEPLKNFFDGIFHAMLNMIHIILKLAPLGVFALTANIVAKQTQLGNYFSSLGNFLIIVIAGLILHGFIIMPMILRSFGINPLKHLFNMRNTILTAFSTSSSNATLPVAMQDVEKLSGVSNKITSFTLPLGATINMNGTALYECVTVMFIAQVYGIELTLIQQIIIVATALISAVGTPGMPMGSMITMSIILTAVGLPLEGISIILAVDRILDMFRTTINVWGDTCGAVVIAKTEGEKLLV